ncbi:MAG: hypothetical protein ACYCSF_09895 [Acidimicrobiales bacterium]
MSSKPIMTFIDWPGQLPAFGALSSSQQVTVLNNIVSATESAGISFAFPVYQWSTPYNSIAPGTDTYPAIKRLATETSLHEGQALSKSGSVFSPNRQFRLQMQRDGNLVLRNMTTGAPLWATGIYSATGAAANLQSDGNFVIYANSSSGSRVLWSTLTNGHADYGLIVTNNEVVRLLATNGAVLWQRPL